MLYISFSAYAGNQNIISIHDMRRSVEMPWAGHERQVIVQDQIGNSFTNDLFRNAEQEWGIKDYPASLLFGEGSSPQNGR